MPVVRVRYLGMLQRLASLPVEESCGLDDILISLDGEICGDLDTPLSDGTRATVVMLSPMMVGGSGCAG